MAGRGLPQSRCSLKIWKRSRRFYQAIFGLPITYEDDNSAVFTFGETMINLLRISEAPELIGPAKVAGPEAGSRIQFTLAVDDVDAMCAELTSRGVELLNGPMDRPWGIRTAASVTPPATSGKSRSKSDFRPGQGADMHSGA